MKIRLLLSSEGLHVHRVWFIMDLRVGELNLVQVISTGQPARSILWARISRLTR